MKLNDLPKLTDKRKKRIGRGIGSGKGKTGGRGMKGQKARGSVNPSFTGGGGLPLYKKLPFRRGLGNRSVSAKPLLIKTGDLSVMGVKTVVNVQSLIDKGVINAKEAFKKGVKVVAGEELKIALTVELPVTKGAKKIIEQVGGTVVI